MNKEIKVRLNENALNISPDELKTFLVGEGVKLTPDEFKYFLMLAQANNLNPFKREIYVLRNKNGKVDFVTGYEVYLKRAQATGLLDGWEVNLEGDNPREAVATVRIWRKDWSHPFVWQVYGSEFYKPSKTKTGAWDKMWKHMLRVRAISQAFRLAFPEYLGGLPYTPEEIKTSGFEPHAEPVSEPTEVEVVDEPDEAIKEEIENLIEDLRVHLENARKQELLTGEQVAETLLKAGQITDIDKLHEFVAKAIDKLNKLAEEKNNGN